MSNRYRPRFEIQLPRRDSFDPRDDALRARYATAVIAMDRLLHARQWAEIQ